MVKGGLEGTPLIDEILVSIILKNLKVYLMDSGQVVDDI